MDFDLKGILEGWGNSILDEFNLLDEKTKEIGKSRLSICNECTMRTHNSCDPDKTGKAVQDFFYIVQQENRIKGNEYKGCGCKVSKKTLCMGCQCPLGKWLQYDDRDNTKGESV